MVLATAPDLPEVDSLKNGREAPGIVHSGHQDVVTVVLTRLRETRHDIQILT